MPGAPFINIISRVAFKQNIPVLAVLLAVGAVVGLYLFLQPPAEDRLKKAVTEHAATLKDARGFAIFGNVADIALADKRVLHVEFVETHGAWKVGKDLGEDFQATLKDPAAVSPIMNRLAQLLAKRFNMDVRVKEGTPYEYVLTRDGDGLRGTVTVLFAYPNDQRRGRYIETWRYTEGRWSNSGVGSLYDITVGATPR